MKPFNMSFNIKIADFLSSFTCCIKCSAEPTISFDCSIGYFSNIWRRILRTSLSRSWDATRRVSFLFSLSIIDEVELSFANTYLTKEISLIFIIVFMNKSFIQIIIINLLKYLTYLFQSTEGFFQSFQLLSQSNHFLWFHDMRLSRSIGANR